jgi:hypothetical protein
MSSSKPYDVDTMTGPGKVGTSNKGNKGTGAGAGEKIDMTKVMWGAIVPSLISLLLFILALIAYFQMKKVVANLSMIPSSEGSDTLKRATSARNLTFLIIIIPIIGSIITYIALKSHEKKGTKGDKNDKSDKSDTGNTGKSESNKADRADRVDRASGKKVYEDVSPSRSPSAYLAPLDYAPDHRPAGYKCRTSF